MNFIKKKWVISTAIVAMVIIATIIFFLFHKNRPLNPGKVMNKPKNATEFVGLEIKVPGSNKNGYWDLKLTKLISYPEVGKMSKISGKYILDKKPVQFISANEGDIVWKDRRLSFKGNVKLKTVDGKSLATDLLTWDPHQKIIRAKGNVWLQTDGLSVKTDGLTITADLKKAAFSGMTRVLSQR